MCDALSLRALEAIKMHFVLAGIKAVVNSPFSFLSRKPRGNQEEITPHCDARHHQTVLQASLLKC